MYCFALPWLLFSLISLGGQVFPCGIVQVDEVNVQQVYRTGCGRRVRLKSASYLPGRFSLIRFVQDILVLCIAQRQSPLACLFSDDELKAAVRGIYRNH